MGTRVARSSRIALYARVLFLAGRTCEAKREADRSLELAREVGERSSEVFALLVLSQLAIGSDRTETEAAAAVSYLIQAMEIAKELGHHPSVAHCDLGLGRLFRRTNERSKSKEHLALAAALYRETGMPYYLRQAEQELADA